MTAGALSLFVWYTISSGSADDPLEITREQLKGWLADAGIDPSYLPTRGRAIDAFRSATSNAVDDYDHQGTAVRLMVRETAATNEYVTRTVVQTWTMDGRAQERKVASLQFFRPHRTAEGRIHGTERMRWLVDQRLTGYHRQRVTEFVDRLVKSYEVKQERLSSHAVRAVVRAFLMDCGAVAMSDAGGGAYLLDVDRLDQARALQGIVRRCGPQCRMRIIPIPDEPDLREMVMESVDTDIASRAGMVAKEISDWMDAHPGQVPTSLRAGSWRADAGVLLDRLSEFAEQHEGSQFPAASEAVARLAELNAELLARLGDAERQRVTR